MAYKMENEELQIASCSIADLTEEQVQIFTEQWGDGSGIETLVLFYEKETGLLVLNRDNEKYEMYKEIAEAFLLTSKSGRRELMEKAPDGMRETLRILDSCIRDRVLMQDVFRAKKGIILDDDMVLFFTLFTTSCCTLFTTVFEIVTAVSAHYSIPIMHIKYSYQETKHII